MIFDHVSNIETYTNISANLAIGLRYLKEANLKDIETGQYFLGDSGVYVMVQEYQTKNKEEMKWESHKKFIDIQYIVSGVEVIGCTNLRKLQLCEEYDSARDIMFYTGEGDYMTLWEECFIILFPEDGHRPWLCLDKPQPVKKVVVKVPVE